MAATSMCSTACLLASRHASAAVPRNADACRGLRLTHQRASCNRFARIAVKAEPEHLSNNTKEPSLLDNVTATGEKGASSATGQQTKDLVDALNDATPEQKEIISELYAWLVQQGPNKTPFKTFSQVQDVLSQYEVLLWRPAELLNGRMAMVGFSAGVGCELLTGQSVWQQIYTAPYAYFLAYGTIVLAAYLNRAFGSPSKGIGPFTPTAELWNGRAAMFGYALLAFFEYNLELKRAAFIYFQQLQHAQLPGFTA